MTVSVSSQEGPCRFADIFTIEWMDLIDPRMLPPTTYNIHHQNESQPERLTAENPGYRDCRLVQLHTIWCRIS